MGRQVNAQGFRIIGQALTSTQKLQHSCLISFYGSAYASKKVHYLHWNRANPMFHPRNNEHILNVNQGNLPWEYDQVNIICPVSKPGVHYPETHVIYSVSKAEYESCRITNPKPRIVAICNDPYKVMYFTITFRSFTPTPGGLEFKPGADYYFISTSSREDLHRRVGGGCASHNMQDNRHRLFTPPLFGRHRIMYDSRVPSTKGADDYIYYYNPRNLVNMEEKFKKKMKELDEMENEIWGLNEEALKLTSASSVWRISHILSLLPFVTLLLLRRSS
ncbi:EFNB [Lepeophtheirus salmonis]|uniref:EFNB n=1 Tax=Lepeophtheirus salmonis TaxID=72036 RepID=A0A7R8CIS1_LEPSM|nr:EFNB [Lepeophtheirus salmonis]CAF2833203.1 EFNB [Lepeophtheirus salmonis]